MDINRGTASLMVLLKQNHKARN
ncbi:BnaA08g29460D [Brassica napus]|uniref:BnaA08g29460D protein n=1 Tax=Brassica napus TaxID=3708 RepID=A0A078IKY8_BRANA|nr:BnaA08g29460D [Brassica napus]